MAVFSTAGSKLYIGTVLTDKPDDFTVSDFTSQTWTAINNLENIGSFGDESEEITFNDIARNRVLKVKGTRNAGNMEVVIGVDYSDKGQIALLEAEKDIFDYAFRIVFNDAPEGGTPSERLFIAKVMKASEEAGEANNIAKLNVSLGINSNIVRIKAAKPTTTKA